MDIYKCTYFSTLFQISVYFISHHTLYVLYINDTVLPVLPIHTIRNDAMTIPEGVFLAFCSHTKWPFYRQSCMGNTII